MKKIILILIPFLFGVCSVFASGPTNPPPPTLPPPPPGLSINNNIFIFVGVAFLLGIYIISKNNQKKAL